jgi:hypothetical protein
MNENPISSDDSTASQTEDETIEEPSKHKPLKRLDTIPADVWFVTEPQPRSKSLNETDVEKQLDQKDESCCQTFKKTIFEFFKLIFKKFSSCCH